VICWLYSLAVDYAPPIDFDRWLACAFYAIALLVAIKHYSAISTGGLVSRGIFDEYRKQAERDREEIKDELHGIEGKIEKFGTDNYKARRLLYGRVNAQSNALYFLAGQIAKGPELRRILDRAEQLNSEADGE
jgi:hypothetical protein